MGKRIRKTYKFYLLSEKSDFDICLSGRYLYDLLSDDKELLKFKAFSSVSNYKKNKESEKFSFVRTLGHGVTFALFKNENNEKLCICVDSLNFLYKTIPNSLFFK